jgi:hypothetical protein
MCGKYAFIPEHGSVANNTNDSTKGTGKKYVHFIVAKGDIKSLQSFVRPKATATKN